MAFGMFRLIGGICRSMTIANTGGALIVLVGYLLGGFTIPKGYFLVLESHNADFCGLTMCWMHTFMKRNRE